MTDPVSPRRPSALTRVRRLGVSARRSPFLRNTGKLTVAEVARIFAGFVQALLVARWLGPRGYGLAALILAYPAFVFTFFDPQASDSVVKYLGAALAVNDDERVLAVPKLAYLVDGSLAVVGVAVVAATASLAANHLLKSGADESLIVIAGAALALQAPSETSQAVLTTLGRFSTVAIAQTAIALARAALVIGLVAIGTGVAGVVWGTSAGVVAESLAMGVLANAALKSTTGHSWLAGRRKAVASDLREMARFLIYTDLASLAGVLVKQADVLILGYLRGPTETGWYRLAQSLISPITSVVTALQTVSYPVFARLAGLGDYRALAKTAKRYLLRIGIPLTAVTLCSIAVVPLIIRIVAGATFLPGAASARWLIAGTSVVLAGFWVKPAMFACGHVRYMFLNGIALATAAIVGFVVLGNAFGATGVAFSRGVIAGALGTTLAALRFRTLARSGRLGHAGASATTNSVIE